MRVRRELADSEIWSGCCVVALGVSSAWAGFLRLDVSNIGQTCLSTAAQHPSGRKSEAPASLPLSKS